MTSEQKLKHSNHLPQIKNSAQLNNNMQSQNQNSQIFQTNPMQNEIQLPFCLEQHEIAKIQLKSLLKIPNTAKSLQMTINPYIIGGASLTSNKPLMVFTGTDPENSVEDYLNAVTANLFLIIGPESVKTPLHQNWTDRRTALI